MRKKQDGALEGGCEDAVVTHLEGVMKDAPEYDLLRLIAQVLDEAASVGECYMVLGTNRTGQAYMITISEGGDKMYATGLSWSQLMEASKSLL
jgi:hypothetical protein